MAYGKLRSYKRRRPRRMRRTWRSVRKIARRTALSLLELRVRSIPCDRTLGPVIPTQPIGFPDDGDYKHRNYVTLRNAGGGGLVRFVNVPTTLLKNQSLIDPLNNINNINWVNLSVAADGTTATSAAPVQSVPDVYAFRDGLRVRIRPDLGYLPSERMHRIGLLTMNPEIPRDEAVNISGFATTVRSPDLSETGGQGKGYISIGANSQFHWTSPPSGVPLSIDGYGRTGTMVRQEFIKVSLVLEAARMSFPIAGYNYDPYLPVRRDFGDVAWPMRSPDKISMNVPPAHPAFNRHPYPTWAMVVFFTRREDDLDKTVSNIITDQFNGGAAGAGEIEAAEPNVPGSLAEFKKMFEPSSGNHILNFVKNRHARKVATSGQGNDGYLTRSFPVPDEVYMPLFDLNVPLKDGRRIEKPSDVVFDHSKIKVWKTDVVSFPCRRYGARSIEGYHDLPLLVNQDAAAVINYSLTQTTPEHSSGVTLTVPQTVANTNVLTGTGNSIYATDTVASPAAPVTVTTPEHNLFGNILAPAVTSQGTISPSYPTNWNSATTYGAFRAKWNDVKTRNYTISLNGAPVHFDDSMAEVASRSGPHPGEDGPPGVTLDDPTVLPESDLPVRDSSFSIADKQLYFTVITPAYAMPGGSAQTGGYVSSTVDSVVLPPWGFAPVRVEINQKYGWRDV